MTDQEAKTECSEHPCAPHGYDRNSSHSLDRYVCDCEWWEPPSFCAGAELKAENRKLALKVMEAHRQEMEMSERLDALIAVGQEWRAARSAAETFNKETWERLADAEAALAAAIEKAAAGA